MNMMLQKAWSSVLAPMLQRPKKLQVAALCYRGKPGAREYLLITSRETKRWIIPKGWPIRGLDAPQTALQEAWEEAGVKSGDAQSDPEGSYTYQKRLSSGCAIPVETLVYSVEVSEVANDFPEADQRRRKWVSPGQAAELVDEPELRQIFRAQEIEPEQK